MQVPAWFMYEAIWNIAQLSLNFKSLVKAGLALIIHHPFIHFSSFLVGNEDEGYSGIGVT